MVYDVLLVNSIMDGMNLVSKEGPIVNSNDGVLVLTTGAGSFEEMGEHAIAIEDAFDIEETAAAIERALEMSAGERKERSSALREAAQRVKPEHWIEAQLEDLQAMREGNPPVSPAC
jgi:trehalose 6-phosphate synthase